MSELNDMKISKHLETNNMFLRAVDRAAPAPMQKNTCGDARPSVLMCNGANPCNIVPGSTVHPVGRQATIMMSSSAKGQLFSWRSGTHAHKCTATRAPCSKDAHAPNSL
ncbi:CMP-N-acetylneuraminic acid synthetase [Anopheles sinensis]|uniref:CMP-N-acetylneuraminic acid synthetase n=1 Tax=Anopheles sinensis TaxID=74873 RepID=A0A084W0F0_ANOSI|nr:CMP-N-acetylneuraminic acid synthetase [Anopheles sinensis]